MRLAVVGLVAEFDVHIEVRRDLVDEADVVPGELSRRTLQRPQVHVEELRALVGERGRSEFRAQRGGPAGQLPRIRRGRVLDLPAQLGVAGVGVDETLLEPVEGQPEQQILADQNVGLHTGDPSREHPAVPTRQTLRGATARQSSTIRLAGSDMRHVSRGAAWPG